MLFGDSLRAAQRAAAVNSLVQLARLNGLDSYANLKDVPKRLPTQRGGLVAELLLHRWTPPGQAKGDFAHPAILNCPKTSFRHMWKGSYDLRMDESEVVAGLAALAHPMRLRAFRALVVAGQEGLTPGVMSETLEVPNATLSFHLKELARAGLVTQERASRHLVYRPAFDRMNGLLGYLTENCCTGAECAVDSDAAQCKC